FRFRLRGRSRSATRAQVGAAEELAHDEVPGSRILFGTALEWRASEGLLSKGRTRLPVIANGELRGVFADAITRLKCVIGPASDERRVRRVRAETGGVGATTRHDGVEQWPERIR